MVNDDFPAVPSDELEDLREAGWRGLPVPPLTSVTAMRDFVSCPRSYFLRTVAGLTPKYQPAALSLGSLVHDVIAHLRCGRAVAPLLEAERERMEAWSMSEESRDRVALSLAVASAVAKNYWAWESKQEPHLEMLHVEHPFTAGKFGLSGRLDMLAKVCCDPWAGLWVEDVKTHEKGREGEILERVPYDKQFATYAAEFGARGVILTLIAKTARRRRKGEALPEYIDRVTAEYADGGMYRRHFEFLPRAADVAADIAAARSQHAHATLRYLDVGVSAWPQNEAHCFSRGRCPFVELCRGEGIGLYRRNA